MPVLAINQTPGSVADRYQIEVTAREIEGLQPQTLRTEISFRLEDRDKRDIRWYLEDYLEFDQEPAPSVARRVEARMAALGEALFDSIFKANDDFRELWGTIRPRLADTRVEITTGINEATAVPWELIRDPRLDRPIALSARAFVRTQHGAPGTLAPQAEVEKVRILLVICRPQAGEDVPFRSVAGRLVTRLSAEAREAFRLDVLRPPTFQRLAEVLRLAKEKGEPYHIVHFDGHGTYADPTALEQAGAVFSNLKLDGGASGKQGFLVFEDPESEKRSAFVDGERLGTLLRESGVPVLVLNACQSAFAESHIQPEPGEQAEAREEVRAYGSLAQAVVHAGAAGVVAMRYVVYVDTAARFVAELYGALARGRELGEAVSAARKHLADKPERQIAQEPRALQDWSVPVVWERAPLRLFPKQEGAPALKVLLDGDAAKSGNLDPKLPARPDLGFFGRDETLYALDRAFDEHSIVLLHAYAGSGKTATAAEFARWYALTGGVQGPVLFTSFERHLPLARVLDKLGEIFGGSLEAAGIPWGAITETADRRNVALQVLAQKPVLWIWDNVEPVTGFPAGSESAWSAAEQRELSDFLRAAKATKAKFLLTSRREESAWLGDLARRVAVPGMPMRERRQLAGAILANRGKRAQDLPDLTPLLRQTQGNPLTILVTMGAALRAGIDTTERLEAFVRRLRNGEAEFEDETSEGRSRSLGASLAYGFEGFSVEERKILALLHLFQGFVDVQALQIMGHSGADCCLEAVRGLSREQGIALLDRAAEIGLLTGHGNGYYGIHPALPWYFRERFEQDHPAAGGEAERARRAFVAAMGGLGNYYANQYEGGQRGVLAVVAAEEDNLLAAWRLAREHGWWYGVISAMQGLRTLYDNTGRPAAWRRLVDAVVPEFVDPTTEGALAGREELWSLVTEYRVRLAQAERRWPEAARLQRLRVDWDRERAAPALAVPAEGPDDRQRHLIRMLVASLHALAEIQREQGEPACIQGYEESRRLAGEIGDRLLRRSPPSILALPTRIFLRSGISTGRRAVTGRAWSSETSMIIMVVPSAWGSSA